MYKFSMVSVVHNTIFIKIRYYILFERNRAFICCRRRCGSQGSYAMGDIATAYEICKPLQSNIWTSHLQTMVFRTDHLKSRQRKLAGSVVLRDGVVSMECSVAVLPVRESQKSLRINRRCMQYGWDEVRRNPSILYRAAAGDTRPMLNIFFNLAQLVPFFFAENNGIKNARHVCMKLARRLKTIATKGNQERATRQVS